MLSSALSFLQSKLWVLLGLSMTISRSVDYFQDGRHAYDLIAASGFLLIAMGAGLDAFRTLDDVARSRNSSVVLGYAITAAGLAVVIASFFVKYLA